MKKLQKKIFIRGKILAETGLHIGGTNTQMGIGGPDNLVIRNPLTQLPMIPGSSLKGKMRSLLELVYGKYAEDGGVGSYEEITGLFGTSADKKDLKSHASRLIVRDAELSNPDNPNWDNTDMLYSEAKTEVVINRLTSAATPRIFERVPAGAEFAFEMVVNVVAEDNQAQQEEEKLIKLLAEGMELLQDDYLGGNGSRGYGKIKFVVEELKQKEYKGDKVEESNYSNEKVFNKFINSDEKDA